jgi:hypothetical protein
MEQMTMDIVNFIRSRFDLRNPDFVVSQLFVKFQGRHVLLARATEVSGCGI